MPNRTLHRNTLKDDAVNSLSLAEEAFLNRLKIISDDFGRFEADLRLVRARALPIRQDISIEEVGNMMLSIVGVGLVQIYKSGPHFYAAFNEEYWLQEQRVRSKVSPYPGPFDEGSETLPISEIPAFAVKCQQLAASRRELPHVAAARGRLSSNVAAIDVSRSTFDESRSTLESRTPPLTPPAGGEPAAEVETTATESKQETQEQQLPLSQPPEPEQPPAPARRRKRPGDAKQPPDTEQPTKWGTPEALMALYNANKLPPWIECVQLTSKRREKFRDSLKQFPDEDFWYAVLVVEPARSKFLRGDPKTRSPGHRGWRISLDWFCATDGQVENCQKVFEGRYRDDEGAGEPGRLDAGTLRAPDKPSRSRGAARYVSGGGVSHLQRLGVGVNGSEHVNTVPVLHRPDSETEAGAEVRQGEVQSPGS